MSKPYIICYMMSTLDGRIDCKMLENMPGEEYYQVLSELNISSSISGRTTAELELALTGKFKSDTFTPIESEVISKKESTTAYDIILDTNGSLLWMDDSKYDKHHIIVTSLKASKEYLKYLDDKNMSYIVCGNESIDLKRLCEILNTEFKINRLGVLGGGLINASFLNENLLDEVDLLLAPGIDGRKDMRTVFDGLNEDKTPNVLTLENVKIFTDGNVWLRYLIK